MAVYYVWSAAVGSANGSNWANAFTTLTTAFATEVAGDTLFVAHDHVEAPAGAITLTASGTDALVTKIVCVNRAGSVPPVSADRRATATITATGNVNITFNGVAHYDGIIFTAGNSTGAASILLSGTSGGFRFDNCSLRCGSSGATGRILIGGTVSGQATLVELNNTTVSFAHVGQAIQVAGLLRWRNTASALLGTVPNELFYPSSGGGGGHVECFGVDLSAAGAGKTIVASIATTNLAFISYMFLDCKLHASVTKMETPTSPGEYQADFVRSGATGVNYAVYRGCRAGALNEETTIVRTGGASDGVTPIAWKIDTVASCSYSIPFEAPPIAIWNDTTGSAVTATVEGIWGGGAVPNDDDVWIEVEYLGDAASPKGSFVNDGKADLLATATGQATSSSVWGGSTTKFKLAASFTALQKGWIYARVKCGKPSSTFYLDPMVTLT